MHVEWMDTAWMSNVKAHQLASFVRATRRLLLLITLLQVASANRFGDFFLTSTQLVAKLTSVCTATIHGQLKQDRVHFIASKKKIL